MKYGYARVSMHDQNLDSQIAELEIFGCQKVFFEAFSGKNRDRPELQNLLSVLKEGDELVVLKLDRLAGSLKDLIFILEEVSKVGAFLKIGNSEFDFSTAQGRLTASLLGAVAEFEREKIRERTLIGLKNARAAGRFGGRPRGFTVETMGLAKKAYLNRKNGLSVDENLILTGIKSRQTLFKYIRAYVEVVANEKGLRIAENGLDCFQ